jgi:hypothetical protein
MGHAIIATYLYRIKRSDTENCWWYNAAKQDIDYLIFEYKRWAKQRRTLYSDLGRENIKRPRMSEDRPKNRLFNTSKAVKPILDFIKATEIGRRPKYNEEEEEGENNRLDEWDLDRLEREEAEKAEEEGEEEEEEEEEKEEGEK